MIAAADMPPLSALRSQADFERALRWVVDQALAQRVRRLVWLDPDFSHWPLDDVELLEVLTAWVRLPQRRLVLVAQQFDVLQRRYPRFVAWRRTWSHTCEAWSPSEGSEWRLPMLAIDDQRQCLQVFDCKHWRGSLSLDEAAVRQWTDEIDVLLQRCETAFPVQSLGL